MLLMDDGKINNRYEVINDRTIIMSAVFRNAFILLLLRKPQVKYCLKRITRIRKDGINNPNDNVHVMVPVSRIGQRILMTGKEPKRIGKTEGKHAISAATQNKTSDARENQP